MKVLVDFTQIPIQKVGVGVYAKETFRIFEKDTDELYFLIQDDDEDMKKTFSCFNVILVRSKFFRVFLFRFLLEQFYIPFLCWKYKIDVVHSLHYSFPLLLRKVKRIVTIHDLTFFIYPEVHTFIKRYYFKFFIKMACKYADAIICVSESTLNDLKKYMKKIIASTKVIPLSCSSKIEVTELEVKRKKRKFGINSSYILFIGTLEPRKNLLNLICAFNEFYKNNEDYVLVIVGKKGWFYKAIFKLIDELNLKSKVLFTGFVTSEEKFILLSGAHTFIYPSIYEGFGLPVLEAITYGIPTITSHLSSLPEVAGDAAFYINPNDALDMARGLDIVSNDSTVREKLRLNAEKQ